MKKILFVVGIIITLLSLLSILPYIFDYPGLSKYEKGYLTGKFILLLTGVVFMIYGKKKKTAHNING